MNRREVVQGIGAGLLGAFALDRRAFAVEAAPPVVRINELYDVNGIPEVDMAPALAKLAGRRIQISGFVSPHTTPIADFLVLTDEPLSFCPHCQAGGDLRADVVVFYPRAGRAGVPMRRPVSVTGVLEIGAKIDPRTGYASTVRLVDAVVASS
jgi:hypothetical protein